ncbi:sensor histidine kinase [Desertivirga arenae]|uniref:sensor histidine kinase n=1 Tax=Desertivirga arenae TaxID=2810309 RepID=UPI001A966977|nr:PAS domain-containing sensor histidine kinase [Pedobacter sp. SYSU D00823]
MEISKHSDSTNDNFLRDKEQFYNQVLQSIEEYAVFTIDMEGRITSWNTGAFYLFGYSSIEILNRSGDILYTPEDIAAHVPEMEMEGALHEGRAVNERYHVKKDRSRFWGSGLVFPLFDKEGKHQGFTKVMRNMTWVKDTEEENREINAFAHKLVSTSLEAFIVLNQDLTINNYSEPFREIFNLEEKQYRGSSIYEVLGSKVEIKELQLLFDTILSDKDAYKDYELHIITGAAKKKIIKVDTRRFTINENGKQVLMQAFEDVTEKKALQEMKDLFIGVASHEIKNPLAVLRVYAQLLERELKDHPNERVKQAVDKVNEHGNRLMHLISRLLDLSRLENFEVLPKMEEFDLYALVLKVVEDLRLTHPSHEVFFDEIISESVCADPVRIQQVLVNLISNAIKYSPGADHIVVSIRLDDQRKAVVVSVHDLGPGIKESEKEKLFSKFQRTENAVKSKITGAGLGLHISKEIVEQHGGELWFESTEGMGTSFYFSLPLVACL